MRFYYDIFIIGVLSLLVGFVVYYFIPKPEVFVGIVATGISLILGLRAYKTENDKIFKEIFTQYNKRYDEEFRDGLNAIVRRIEEQNAQDLSPDEENLVMAYVDMCSEEYLWYKLKRLPKEVWEAWWAGMLYFFDKEYIRDIVHREMKDQSDFYYGLYVQLEKEFKRQGKHRVKQSKGK